MEKIFGDFKSIDDLNKTAKNLKDNEEYDELLILGQENGIDEERIKEFYDSEDETLVEDEQKCRICGCTENDACEGGCYWVENDLCSKCAEKMKNEEKEVPIKSDETAVAKMQREIKEAKNKVVPVKPIVTFLIAECERDADLGNLILIPHKTLEKCFSYVEKKARSKINGNAGWIADDEVYSWALEYFKLDDAEIEKAEAEKRKKEEVERKKRNEEAKNNKPVEAKKENKDTDKKQNAPVKKSKVKDDSQLSLFDFGGTDSE